MTLTEAVPEFVASFKTFSVICIGPAKARGGIVQNTIGGLVAF